MFDASAANATDETDSGYDLTANSDSDGPDQQGSAIRLNRVDNEYYSIAHASCANLQITGNLTLCGKFKLKTNVGTDNWGVIGKHNVNLYNGQYAIILESVNLDEGLISHWEMDDNADSSLITDETGNHHATLYDASGNPYTSSHSVGGKVGSALDFDGGDDLMMIDHHMDFLSMPFSISLWTRLDTLPSSFGYDPLLLYKATSTVPFLSWLLYADNANDKITFIIADPVPAYKAIISNSPIVADRWYHVVVTYGATGTMRMYIDSVLQSSTNTASSIYQAENLAELCIGNSYLLTSGLDGRLDNICYYNVELRQNEVNRIYNNRIGTANITDIVGNYLKFVLSSDGTSETSLTSNKILVADTWYTFIATYDGSTMKLFVNSSTPTTQAYAGGINDGSAPFEIGRINVDDTTCADIEMEFMSVFSRILTG
jgi:hypothetical protein